MVQDRFLFYNRFVWACGINYHSGKVTKEDKSNVTDHEKELLSSIYN